MVARRTVRHRRRHVGRGTKYTTGGSRRRHRMRGSGGYDITGQIPLIGGLIQAIGSSIHGNNNW